MRCNTICLLGGVCLILPGLAAAAKKPSIAAQLVGAWELVSIDERNARGEAVVPLDYGPEPIGLLVYDASGRMTAQAMRRGRPRLPTDDVHRAPAEAMKTAMAGYAAYFGPYEVDEKASVVTHRVEGSLLPNWEGSLQRRKFTLSGNTLVLEPPPFQANGETRSRRLTWRRVESKQ